MRIGDRRSNVYSMRSWKLKRCFMPSVPSETFSRYFKKYNDLRIEEKVKKLVLSVWAIGLLCLTVQGISISRPSIELVQIEMIVPWIFLECNDLVSCLGYVLFIKLMYSFFSLFCPIGSFLMVCPYVWGKGNIASAA